MGRKEQAVELLRQGLSPSAIAERLGTSTTAVMQYLCLKIGEGELRRSDLAFAIPRELRHAIEQAIERTGKQSAAAVMRDLRKHGVEANRLDVGVYINYRRGRVVLGDMYELVRSIEVRLHSFIKQAFIAEFGEEQWWRSGVPDNIRAECAALLEKDPEPASEPYCYTHLINIREILDKRWPELSKYLPKHMQNQKKDLLERLLRLNRIRNSVMHPVRNVQLNEEEFEFVRDISEMLGELKLQTAPSHEDSHEQMPLSHDVPNTAAESGAGEVVTAITATKLEQPAPEEAASVEEVSSATE